MSNLATAGLGLIAALTPTAGYTAVVVNSLVLNNETTSFSEAGKLGIAGLLVGVITVPLVTWVLRRLEKVSDALVKSKEEKHSAEMLDVKKDLSDLKQLIDKLRPPAPPTQ